MDFESPDVEKDFPGLYASESGRKSNESDCKFFIVFIIMVFHSSFDMNCMFSDKNVKAKNSAKNSEKKQN